MSLYTLPWEQDIRSHLKSRHVDLSLHKVYIDEIEYCATFPLWNLSGQMVGYQTYRPDSDKVQKNNPKLGRYYTHRNKETIGVWGLESWYLSNVLFVTEGIFDAARLTHYGASAIATLSNDPNNSTREWMYSVRSNRFVVSVCDAGPSGNKLKKLGHKFFQFENGDLGDASDEIVKKILKLYC